MTQTFLNSCGLSGVHRMHCLNSVCNALKIDSRFSFFQSLVHKLGLLPELDSKILKKYGVWGLIKNISNTDHPTTGQSEHGSTLKFLTSGISGLVALYYCHQEMHHRQHRQ